MTKIIMIDYPNRKSSKLRRIYAEVQLTFRMINRIIKDSSSMTSFDTRFTLEIINRAKDVSDYFL